jgi:hypothetical protein
MHLTFSPQAGLPGAPETTLHVAGDVLTVDGTPFDLSPVPEGGDGEWPDSPFIGRIRRLGGVIHATLRVTLGPTAADDQPTDPGHWIIASASGVVTIPAARRPETEDPA